ncbi:MAG TPA: formyltetrahydrofolate deformylase [Alphaproteobacteria bacterium]|nr:formyltetrahydrofolate deformylase [Alphaproteobacteria bacterium]
MTAPAKPTYILTIVCPDRKGIVAAVSGFLADRDAFIVESAHFGDPISGRFFLRTVFQPGEAGQDRAAILDEFVHVARRFEMQWEIHDAARKPRMLVMVSRFGHCLNDLLYRSRAGILPVEIPAIVSNHTDFAQEASWHGIPFHHLPVDRSNKKEQEAKLWEMVKELRIDLVVLARYMQILSPELTDKLMGRCINIHHSFLPSFKGAQPYSQAYDRGVKLIGATAHYVTSDLDEGPIIEQAVERVDHTQGPEELSAVGRDIESVVLARAVRYHVEHRVLLNGRRTVVLR